MLHHIRDIGDGRVAFQILIISLAASPASRYLGVYQYHFADCGLDCVGVAVYVGEWEQTGKSTAHTHTIHWDWNTNRGGQATSVFLRLD